MEKSLKLTIAFVIAIFTLPFIGGTAFAKSSSTTESLNYIILKDDANALSTGIARSFNGKAEIEEAANGKKVVRIPFTGKNMIANLSLQGQDSEVLPGKNSDEGILTFAIDGEMPSEINMDMTIDAGSYGTMHHTVRLFLGVQNMDEIPADLLEATLIKKEDNNTEQNTSIVEDNGLYTVNFAALRTDSDKASAMTNYLVNPAFVSVKDGKYLLTFAVANNTVTKLTVNNQKAQETKIKDDTRYETFALDNLPNILNAYVEYQAPYNGKVIKGKSDFRISLDDKSVKEATAKQQYAAVYHAPKTPNPDSNKDTDKNKQKPVKQETKENKNTATPDKAYEINYVIKHATLDKESAANQFFVQPAVLLVKDGVNYIQLTVKNYAMIDSIKTGSSDVHLVKKNKDGSAVVQFQAGNDLSKPITLTMHVTVPDGYGVPGGYSMDHEARLFFDISSKKETDPTKYEIATVSKTKPGKTNQTDKQDKTVVPAVNHNQTNNPQTGDTSNILLYVLLLIGSSIPLIVTLKRRFNH